MVQLDNLPEVARRDKNFLDTDESGDCDAFLKDVLV
jgi:hypothetical protein|tara:strand:+ start:369 stop:476 length:108 start_codon:yes stop_codon:yes gene_type:complete